MLDALGWGSAHLFGHSLEIWPLIVDEVRTLAGWAGTAQPRTDPTARHPG